MTGSPRPILANCFRCYFCLAILCSLLPACAAQPRQAESVSAFDGWKSTDLRYLQAPGEDPEHSLVAAYTRQTALDLEIRLDFLDLAAPQDFDLYLALDTRSGGSSRLPIEATADLSFDLLVEIPAGELPIVLDDQLASYSKLTARVEDHPGLDALAVQLNRSQLPGSPDQPGLQVFLTRRQEKMVLNQTAAILPGSLHPTQANLLMVFWDTLPGATPSQALRRWDGAHTGPYGGNHGLSVLLDAASAAQVPLVLADLKQSTNAVSLAAVGGVQRVQQSVSKDELLLPEAAVAQPGLATQALTFNQGVARKVGLAESSFAFGDFAAPLPAGPKSFFAELSDPVHLVTWQGKRLIPLPQAIFSESTLSAEPEVDLSGPSLTVRRKLLDAALSNDPGRILALGGSLPSSPWGEFSVAPFAFQYLATHPWIHVLDEADLLQLPAPVVDHWPLASSCTDLLCAPIVPDIIPITSSGAPVKSGTSYPDLISDLYDRLKGESIGAFTQTAWQALFTLSRPTGNLSLAGLQANALGQIGYLLKANRWAANFTGVAACDRDLDYDGAPECLLASDRWLAIVKTDGARLVFAARRNSQTADQWAGTSALFAVGFGDPSEWKPESGPGGDPDALPGGFSLSSAPYETYTAVIQAGQVLLRNASGSVQKIFQIEDDSLKVSISSSAPAAVQLPITLAPQDWVSGQPVTRFLSAPSLAGGRWIWQPVGEQGLKIEILGASEIKNSSFLDSHTLVTAPENPNLAYPPGHYLPYPFALIEWQGTQVEVNFSTP